MNDYVTGSVASGYEPAEAGRFKYFRQVKFIVLEEKGMSGKV